MKHLAFTGSLIVCFCFLIGCQKPTEDMDISYTISGKVLNEATSEYYGSDKYISIFGTRKLGKVVIKIMDCIAANFPQKCFYNEENHEIYIFYRQG